jgi:kynurenine formamidase
MEPIFLSHFLTEDTPTYGGAKGTIVFEKVRSISKGDTSNNLKFEFPAHVGTHIDFPLHFSDDGKKCSDYPPSFWMFKKIGFLQCEVDEIEDKINELPRDIEILIVKTGFGKKRGTDEYWLTQPVIPCTLSKILRNQFSQLRIFGFDMISMTSKLDREEGKKAHIEFLLNNDILILEDMDLRLLDFTPNLVIVAPLLIKHADGVPCTILAFK